MASLALSLATRCMSLCPFSAPAVVGIKDALLAIPRRWAKRRVGSVCKNGRSTPGRRLGIKVPPDAFVKTHDILVRQRGLRFHPGPNTVVGHDQTLNATEDGIAHLYSAYYTYPIRNTSHMSVRKRKYFQVICPKTHPQLFNEKDQLVTYEGAILETENIRRSEEDALRLVNIRKNAQDSPDVFMPRRRLLKKVDAVVADKIVTDALRMQLGDEHWMVKDRESLEQQKYGSSTKNIKSVVALPE